MKLVDNSLIERVNLAYHVFGPDNITRQYTQWLGISSLMASFPSRSSDELVDPLERHIRVLRDYATKAFREGNFDYGGEVAGKLRLLVTKFGSNRPLLLDLITATGIAPTITLDGPPVQRPPGEPGPGDTISLERYLGLGAIGVRIPSGEFVMLNKDAVDPCLGGAKRSSHEDWSLDPALATILSAQIYIGGLHGALAELATTTGAVLSIGDQFYRSIARGPAHEIEMPNPPMETDAMPARLALAGAAHRER
jgi:hypothetical protein